MSSKRWWLVAPAGLLGAYSARNEVTSPTKIPLTPAPRSVMRPDGPLDVAGQPGETLADFPRVKVVKSDTGAPAAGVSVTFSRSRDRMSRTVVTDAQGIAHSGEFKFDTPSGPDQVLAMADQMPSI